MRYATLEGVALEAQHRAFLAAFADYALPTDLTEEQFARMLRRTGCRPELSMGAFEGKELVGFIHNGIRLWQGKWTAYDQGTAVLPAFRQRGVTSALFAALIPVLRAAGVRRYLLEVLQQNEAAHSLYRKNGFRVTREFDCCTLVKGDLAMCTGRWAVQIVEDIHRLDWTACAALWDCSPSWQNSPDSVLATAECHTAATVTVDGALAGYGVVDRASGAVSQLAVGPAHRRAGLGRALLAALGRETTAEKQGAINVQSGSSGAAFLQALGFTTYVRQYEMVLELD